jgi:sulfide:quinone oxidoreductase
MKADGRMRVVIAGGGVAALEATLALRDLAGERLALTLVAPDGRFTYRPLSVTEPFALGRARTVPLAGIARDLGAELIEDGLAAVRPAARQAILAGGAELDYDALLVAIGARRTPAFEHAITFRGQEDSEPVHGLIQDLEAGYLRRIAFVVPPSVAWPLPLYELALMTAQRAYEMGLDELDLTLVTPEPSPLAVFGPAASDDVRQLLEAAGIAIRSSARGEVPDGTTVVLHPGGRTLSCDRVLALPAVESIPIDGLPGDAAGFVRVDAEGRVRGLEAVYAAGDGTSFPVKQGGLACQQADAAAAAIARQAGADVEPRPFKPVLRGELLTGSAPLYLRTDLSGGAGDRSESSGHTLWWPPSKIAGRHLAPYLAREEAAPAEGPAGGARRVALVTEALDRGHGIDLLGLDIGDEEHHQ